MFFMFANTVVIPLTIGDAFHLSSGETAGSLQRSFIYTGAACVLQALLGHKYPLMEGQSGLWWGTILSLATSAASAGLSLKSLGGALETGFILSGILVAALGAFGITNLLQRLFTPVVMSTVLFLLAGQLIIIFTKGMLGVKENGEMTPEIACLSLFLIVLVATLIVTGRGILSNFAILIGIVIGWILYSIFFPNNFTNIAAPALIRFFPWGKPNFQIGIIIMVLITGLVNTTNTMAAIKGADVILNNNAKERQYQRSFVLTGMNSIISGIFGMVPYAPYISSIGFLQSTRIFEVTAFLIGAILFMIMGLVPELSHFFSTMPISVGDAVLFTAYLQLFGGALTNLEGFRFSSKTIYRIAAPVLTGFAIMTLPAKTFEPVSMLIRPLLSNGLIMGILIAMILDNAVNWKRLDLFDQNH